MHLSTIFAFALATTALAAPALQNNEKPVEVRFLLSVAPLSHAFTYHLQVRSPGCLVGYDGCAKPCGKNQGCVDYCMSLFC